MLPRCFQTRSAMGPTGERPVAPEKGRPTSLCRRTGLRKKEERLRAERIGRLHAGDRIEFRAPRRP